MPPLKGGVTTSIPSDRRMAAVQSVHLANAQARSPAPRDRGNRRAARRSAVPAAAGRRTDEARRLPAWRVGVHAVVVLPRQVVALVVGVAPGPEILHARIGHRG